MKTAKTLCFILALTSLSLPARSDTGLYPEAAPADASFLRFIGFERGEPIQFAGKSFDIPKTEGAPYVPVSAALLQGIQPGAFLTVVKDSTGQLRTIQEGAVRDPGKVHLFLINTTPQNLNLRVAGSETVVIQGISAMQSGTRAVNPVSIGLSVVAEDGGEPLRTFQVNLQRGQNLSFLATPTGVQLIEHRFDPVAQ